MCILHLLPHEEGNQLVTAKNGSDTIHYTYDKDGDLVYMVLNGALCYYERNAQNDIIGLVGVLLTAT
ncbi:hypothetical protein [Ethanoligenens sp.]|uniref:hypothetical protein n=1 Tax=Ethanoligenens sp. TaxID=2099655 RepID=UPI0039EC26EF